MKLRFDLLVLSAHFALLCSDRILTQATDLPSQTTDQDVSRRGHEGNHEGHQLLELEKKNELEVELLKLKHSVNEDEADAISVSSTLRDTSRGGQPEYINEDLEEELTGIRPLEIPLHLSEVGRVSDLKHQHYATNTTRTFGELDFEGLTTISDRMSELQIEKESKDNTNDSSEWDQNTNTYRLRTEEVEQNLDGSNVSPPVTTTTEKYRENTADIEEEENEIENENEEDDDGDDYDDDDDDNDDHDDDDDDDDGGGGGGGGSGGDNYYCGDDENDDADDNEDSGDGDNEDNTDNDYSNTQNSSINSEDNKKTHGREGKSKTKTVESTRKMSKKSKTFQDSVEHGRQWKDNSEEISTAGSKSDEEVSSLTTTSASATSHSALQLELAAFLKNESPEAEDPENRNLTEGVGMKDGGSNTKEHRQSEEAELDTFRKLQQIRELEKRANIPQQLVDSVSPKADEDLLELMVRIAENPAEWQQVHHVLQRLDDDLVTSRKSLLEAKAVGKSRSREEKKTADEEEAVHVFSNKNKEKMQHRKYQQAEKKKKKKQKQKEKLKATGEEEAPTFKVKSKEEIRREALEKAGVLQPANAVFKDSNKGKTSKVSKEMFNSKIKDNSLSSSNSANIRNRNKNIEMNFDKETKERGKAWSIMEAQKGINDHMSSIDSAIAYLSEREQPLAHLNNKKMPRPTKPSHVREKYNLSESLNGTATDINRTHTWSNPSEYWGHNSNKLYGSFSNSKPDQKVVNSHIKSDDWIKTPSGLENMYGETDSKNLVGAPSFSTPLGKSTPKNRMPPFRGSLHKEVSERTRPTFGNSLDKDVPENEAHSWKELQTVNNNRWSGLNPKEERRYYGGDPVYNSPNRGWPRFSVESLKHGNLAGNVKTWPNLPIDQSMDSNREGYSIDETSDNWPNFPFGRHISMQNPYAYNWPKFSDDRTSQNSITSDTIGAWSKPSLDPSVPKQTEVNTNNWSHIKHPHQKPVSPIARTLAHHTKEASSSKQWPHFAYHRVTSSPQILVQQQKEAQQRARHRNAYIAVSVIAPPGKSKGLNRTQNKTNSSLLQTPERAWNKVNEPPTKPPATPLPDKMDQLLAMQSEKQKFPDGEDLLEEQLVDMAVAGQQQRSAIPWSHARHLDKIQEQLKTLSDMGEKLRYHWLEKERLLQILRDGGKNGSGFFRSQRDESTGRETATITTPTTSIDPPNPLPASHTTHPTLAP